MENTEALILTVLTDDLNTQMTITYDNSGIEVLPINKDTIVRMHDAWLIQQPPFISDLYKLQMRNIILTTINNNTTCLAAMCKYFSHGNETEVKKFLTYMRKRDLTYEKSKWTPV